MMNVVIENNKEKVNYKNVVANVLIRVSDGKKDFITTTVTSESDVQYVVKGEVHNLTPGVILTLISRELMINLFEHRFGREFKDLNNEQEQYISDQWCDALMNSFLKPVSEKLGYKLN